MSELCNRKPDESSYASMSKYFSLWSCVKEKFHVAACLFRLTTQYPAPVEGVVLPERPDPLRVNTCDGEGMPDGYDDYFPANEAIEHFALLERLLAEAIAQRDEAQRRLSSAIEAFGISEAALITARDHAVEIIRKYDTTIGQEFTTFPESHASLLDHLQTIDTWLGLYKDRAEKLEAALAIARAHGREEGLREAAEECQKRGNHLMQEEGHQESDTNAWVASDRVLDQIEGWDSAKEAILSLIPKK